MLLFADIIKGVAEVGFPIMVAVYLLIYQGKQLDRVREALVKVRLGLYLILNKLDLTEDYTKAVQELKRSKEEDGDE